MAKDQTFCVVFGIANLGLFLYGLLALFRPDILYETFARHVYQFPSGAGFAVSYTLALYRLLDFFNLLVGLAGLFLLWRFSIEPQPWLARWFSTIRWETLAFSKFSNTLYFSACWLWALPG